MAAALPNRIPNDGARHRSEFFGSNGLTKNDLAKNDPRERLIVALDVSSAAAAQKIVETGSYQSTAHITAIHAAAEGQEKAVLAKFDVNSPTKDLAITIKADGGKLAVVQGK